MADVVLERALARLERLIDAAPARIESPSVVGTHEAVLPDLPILERREPVRTANAEQSWVSRTVAKQDEIFGKHSDRHRDVFQAGRQAHRVPVAPQHLAGASSRPGTG